MAFDLRRQGAYPGSLPARRSPWTPGRAAAATAKRRPVAVPFDLVSSQPTLRVIVAAAA
jgi:hypothetical protein